MVAELRDTSVVANMVTVVAAQILMSGWKCHCSRRVSGYLGIWVWGSTTGDLFALLRASMDICMLWSTMRMGLALLHRHDVPVVSLELHEGGYMSTGV
jgi:hypothetical protein